MLTSRIFHLIKECQIPPYQVLAVTFTNKAATEMRERVERELNSQASVLPTSASFGRPEIGTFHSICVRVLRRSLPYTPFSQPFVIFDDSDQLSLIKSVLKKLSIDEKSFSPKAFQAAINRAKCDARDPQEIQTASMNVFYRHLRTVYEEYQKDLFANNALDFGEIICMTYRIFRDHPELREKFQKQFQYIHVDEYQDTNRSQYLLLSMLAKKANGGHENICVVGDEDQSIYKWRGADIRNILEFEKDYPNTAIVKLEQNYRSSMNILSAANHVIQNNKARKNKVLWTQNPKGSPLIRVQLPDERAEAEMVVSEIQRLAQTKNRNYGDFAIFYRTHFQSRSFEDVLRREKIPYQVVGGIRFYDRREIKDILSYFRVILNPSDSVSLKRVLNVPNRGIGKTTLEKLETLFQIEGQKRSLTFWDLIQEIAKEAETSGSSFELSGEKISAAAAKKIHTFAQLIERFMREQPQRLLSELYRLILDETGYLRELKGEGTEESESRIENLQEFDVLLQEFEEDVLKGKSSLTSFDSGEKPEENIQRGQLLSLFIEQSALASENKESQVGLIGSVKLMTLHSSKGLEFPVVFIVGMEEGLFPSIKQETTSDEIEEERRLCYVGMTRGREQVYLSHALVRRIWGNSSYQQASRFLLEIPEELIEVRDFSYRSRLKSKYF
jgi:DNA helicase-2/ATP-dependent DNA helicase PcrA